MKKIIIALAILLIGYSISTANCNIPTGVSSTPAWTQGIPVRVYIAYDCWVEWEYCWRINSNGEREVILGDFVVTGKTPWYLFTSCKHEYNKRKETIMDYSISAIINSQNIFGLETPPCTEGSTPPSYYVYSASCLTEPFFDWTQPTNGKQVMKPCNLEGFCKYEFRYCFEYLSDGGIISTYTKNLITGSGELCPGTYTFPNTQVVYDCYPEDCFPSRLKTKVPELSDVISTSPFDDSNYYILNSFAP